MQPPDNHLYAQAGSLANADSLARAGSLDAVRWLPVPSHGDERGVLSAVESGIDIPFEIARVYFLHHVSADRGGHAHRETHQLLIAAAGRCEVLLSDGRETRAWLLDDPTKGLLLGPMLFIRMQNFSPDVRLLVLASTHYDKSRSLRSWEEYLEAIGLQDAAPPAPLPAEPPHTDRP